MTSAEQIKKLRNERNDATKTAKLLEACFKSAEEEVRNLMDQNSVMAEEIDLYKGFIKQHKLTREFETLKFQKDS